MDFTWKPYTYVKVIKGYLYSRQTFTIDFMHNSSLPRKAAELKRE